MKSTLRPASDEAYQLLHDGALAMARMSEAGLRVDVAYLNDSIRKVKRRIFNLEQALSESKEHKVWRRRFGNNMKLDSAVQLGTVIFEELGHKRNPQITDTNDYSAFEHLKLPFLTYHFEVKRLRKALVTNLYGIKRETVAGYVHPSIHGHSAESYRFSMSDPNLQNQPIRNKIIAEIVRSCIIPRRKRKFVELDLSAHEVRINACYSKDKKLISYVTGGGDMHMDRAMEIYMLTLEEVTELTRYCAKNKFVFPEFYGSYFQQTAPDLWDAISLLKLTRKTDGVSLFDHLKEHGIRRLGACDPEEKPKKHTFESHVKEVERHMWEEVYTEHTAWKQRWWEMYEATGGVNTLTGFRMEGDFRKNQILADPIQGSAFHCDLWTIIELQKEIDKRRMKSLLVLQIHDSILGDVPDDEIETFIELAEELATRRIRKHWKWLIVPLGVDFKIAEENWYKGHKLERAAS